MTTPSHLELLRLLSRHGVPFVVIGGHAVSFHGHIRATEDVDLIWLRSPEAENTLLGALQEAHAQWIADEIDPATGIEQLVPVTLPYIRSSHLMMLVTDFGFLDLFDYVPGYPDTDPQQLFSESILSDQIRYVSLQWLEQMKKTSGRAQDQADLKNLD